MAYADLHVHSNYSYDGTSNIETILRAAAENTNLSILAITDHDEIEGALIAEKRAATYGLSIVTGSEISTSEGHLLALFIKGKVPAGLSLIDSLLIVERLGGICIAPHPGAKFTSSISISTIIRVMEHPVARKVLVGIEVFNAGLFRAESNSRAMEFALNHDIAITANSDAHVSGMIGRAATGFSGNSIYDLRHALENHQTFIYRSYPISSSYIVLSWLYERFISRQVEANKSPSTLPT